jgi:PPK2 family polyphosphate:nucleotide phosphotransferase
MAVKLKIDSPYFIKHNDVVRLDRLPTDTHVDVHASQGQSEKKAAEALTARHSEQLARLQEVFYAARSTALLIVIQGMDTAGKDGTIRHIFSDINPQGCDVASFKVPTPLEASHEFLWRCQKRTPARGMMTIFNRSHYEDVLSPVVHGLIDKKTARRRLDDINAWERTLTDSHTIILKFFLHISREEQTRRLQSRIDDPDKRWKLSPADFAERPFWPAYQAAYQDILRHTSHKHAPWFVIPADHKWSRNVAISGILVDVLRSRNLKYPAAAFDAKGLNLDKLDAAQAAKKVAARAAKSAKSTKA